MSVTGFDLISLEECIELHNKANPGTKKLELLGLLNYALAAKARGVTCTCGQPLWVIGSAEGGLGLLPVHHG